MRIRQILKKEDGIAFLSVMGVISLVTMLSVTAAYLTQTELLLTQIQSESSKAFNIAEAGVERALAKYGQNYPKNIPVENTAIFTEESLNGGDYSTFYKKDPKRVGNMLITSHGGYNDHERTIEVSVRGVPLIFNYGVIVNGGMQFEGSIKGVGYGLINGNVHANGDMNFEGGHFFINTPTYQGPTGWQVNPFYDPEFTLTADGNIVPNSSTFAGGYDPVNTNPVQFPQIDYDFYRDQTNFTNQEVFVYSGDIKNWTVASFNALFAPTGSYTSSIVIMEEGGVHITGGGTITSTILVGPSETDMRDIEFFADIGQVINLMPAISPSILASMVHFGGDVNVGTPDAGAVIIATEMVQIEGQWNNSGRNKKQNQPSNVIIHGTLAVGDALNDETMFDLSGPDNAQNSLQIHYTKTVLDRLPAGWELWGETSMYKDNWKES